MTSAASLPSASREFPYRIERQAGAGAMGVVYRAIDINLDRPVAIKFLKPDAEQGSSGGGDDEASKRFLQEARAAAALSHPGVATIHRVDKVSGQLYIVMEWLEGRTFEALIDADAPLPPARAAAHLFDLLDVLEAAHTAGVVHRDIKPSNLMLLDSGQLKVTDFGIARLQGRSLVETVAGSVLATPRYASPEQLQGEPVDGRADLFAAAVVFYQLVSRQLPWDGDNLAQLINAMFARPPVPVTERDPRLPAALDPWVHKALAKDREARFATAREMAFDLRQRLGLVGFDRQDHDTSVAGAVPRTGAAGPVAEGSLVGSAEVDGASPSRVLAVPVDFFSAPQARNRFQAVRALVESWPVQVAGVQERDDFLKKLLEAPLHAPAFAGAARFDKYLLLVERGVLLTVVDVESGQAQPEGELPDRGEVRLHAAPPDHGEAFVCLLASALRPAEPLHRDLDSEVVNLAAFAGKLQRQGFRGVVHLNGGQLAKDAFGLILLDGARTEMVLLSGAWPTMPTPTATTLTTTAQTASQPDNLASWLRTPGITACVTPPRFEPPASWYPLAFADLDVVATPERAAAAMSGSGSGSSSTLTGTFEATGGLTSEASPLFRLAFQPPRRASVGPAGVEQGPMARFLRWMLEDLPRLLVERQQADGWKYLGDWLLLVRQARLYTQLERPGSAERDYFDLATQDEEGKLLHVARRLPRMDTATFHAELETIKQAKQARTQRGDVGGAFLIAPSFDTEVVEAYRGQLHQGLGNRLLGLDKSMGYQGFVRLGARRGFHLLLVEETIDGFRPRLI